MNKLYIKDQKQKKRADMLSRYFRLLNRWLLLKNHGQGLKDYFLNNKYYNIAIYGMGDIASRLREELDNTGINVIYGIDKEVTNQYVDLKIYALDEKLPSVDAIIITPITATDEIIISLLPIADYPMISLEDVIFSF